MEKKGPNSPDFGKYINQNQTNFIFFNVSVHSQEYIYKDSGFFLKTLISSL
jgi:hypothetical protein